MNYIAHQAPNACWILIEPDYDGSDLWSARHGLRPGVRDVHHVERRMVQLIVDVTRDSDDFAQLQRCPLGNAFLPHSVLARPKPARQALRDDHLPLPAILIIECAS